MKKTLTLIIILFTFLFIIAQESDCIDGYITITCDGGSWQSEVAWTITSSDGTTLSGGAPFTGEMCLSGEYTILMTDSFGDGWNGNVLVIGTEIFSLDSGYEGESSGDTAIISGCTDETACNYNPIVNNTDNDSFLKEVQFIQLSY